MKYEIRVKWQGTKNFMKYRKDESNFASFMAELNFTLIEEINIKRVK